MQPTFFFCNTREWKSKKIKILVKAAQCKIWQILTPDFLQKMSCRILVLNLLKPKKNSSNHMHPVCEAFWMSWLSLNYWVIWIAKSLESAPGAPALLSTAPSQCTVIWFDKNCPKNQICIKWPIPRSIWSLILLFFHLLLLLLVQISELYSGIFLIQ